MLGFSSQRLARINTVMQRYVDEGKLAGIVTLVARRNQVVHFEKCGMAAIETGQRMEFNKRKVELDQKRKSNALFAREKKSRIK